MEEQRHVTDDTGIINVVKPSKMYKTPFRAFFPDANVATIPETQSVSLLLTGLPADCAPKKLLDAIRGYGRIWSVKIHPPHPFSNQDSPIASATLSFFEVAAARFFLEDVTLGSFFVDGYRVHVCYHPWLVAGKERLRTESRCVLVEGHPDLVNEASLLLLLRSRLLFLAGRSLVEIKENVVDVRHRYVTTRRNVVELRFHEGFYGKAGLAVDVLQLEDNPRIWAVTYGDDPCAKRRL
ncbi:hypothetical protein PG993_012235 [Apiospora rasikravindrae]|uniref:RRM domain-containing protein n=1 Tax=Apiospora rasikravindrae TaxID=990691 RepID=A0ABR1S468_9PEZI